MGSQNNDQWSKVLNLLSLRLSKPTFETWLKSTTASVEESAWIIHAENEFARDWINDRFVDLIKEAIFQVTDQRPHVFISADAPKIVDDIDNEKVDYIVTQIAFLSWEDKKKLADTLDKMITREAESEMTNQEVDRKIPRNEALAINQPMDELNKETALSSNEQIRNFKDELHSIKNQITALERKLEELVEKHV